MKKLICGRVMWTRLKERVGARARHVPDFTLATSPRYSLQHPYIERSLD